MRLRTPSSSRASLGALLLLAHIAFLSGCTHSEAQSCPGTVLVSLALHGTLASSGCVVPPSSGFTVPATLPDVAPTATDPVPTFDAQFATDETTGVLAYCTGTSYASVLLGTQTGNHLTASVTLDGAVLGSCSTTCTPATTITIDGDLATSTTGTPTSFSGTLEETLDNSPGSCGECVLPCTFVYDLSGQSI